jgi:hypothetical protein
LSATKLISLRVLPELGQPRFTRAATRARCVADLIRRGAPDGVWAAERVAVVFATADGDPHLEADGALSVPVAFDLEAWGALAEPQQRRVAATALGAALQRAQRHAGLDPAPAKLAEERARSRGLVNEQRWRKPAAGPQGRKAQLMYRFEAEEILVLAQLQNRRGEPQGEVIITRLPPEESALDATLGKLSWAGTSGLILESRDGQRSLSVNFIGQTLINFR